LELISSRIGNLAKVAVVATKLKEGTEIFKFK